MKYTYYFNHAPIRINQFNVFKDELSEQYTYFSINLKHEVMDQINQFYVSEQDTALNVRELSILDKEKCLSLKNIEFSSPFYLFCRVMCKTDRKAVLVFNGRHCGRLWINGQICSMWKNQYSYVAIADLYQGENIFIIDMCDISQRDTFYIRLSSYEEEVCNNNTSLLYQNYTLSKAHIVSETDVANDEDSALYRAMLICNNPIDIDIDQSVSFRLYYETSGQCILESNCRFLEPIEIDLKKRDVVSVDDFDAMIVEFHYIDRSQTSYFMKQDVTIYDREKLIGLLNEEAQKILQQEFLQKEVAAAFSYHQKMLFYLDDFEEQEKENIRILYRLIQQYHSDHLKELNQQSERYKRRYYWSKLDDSASKLTVLVPEQFDQTRKYPLLITLSTMPIERWNSSLNLVQYDREIIAVDVSSRGMTLGSYMCEAIIDEAINQIIANYNIDESRIYLMGFSNGAASAWSYSKNHPSRIAAVCTLSGPVSDVGIDNMSNIASINISSKGEKMYEIAYQNIQKKLNKTTKSENVLLTLFTHNDISLLRCKKKYIDYMLQYTSDPYPRTILYETNNYRNRIAYWIQIDEIKIYRKDAKIFAEVVGNDIRITTRNIAAFEIHLPPYIDRSRFYITINKKIYSFEHYKEESISFSENSEGYCVNGKMKSSQNSRKGMGLLDVYFDPLKIIIPDQISNINMKLANSFSSPYSNGSSPKIYVKYPILHGAKLKIDETREYSLVLIDDNSEEEWTNEIKKHFHIQTDQYGFRYDFYQYQGEYCLMQIMQHPLNEQRSILHICYNNENCLRENLFTRRFVIPSYAFGVHPYLNNEALVYMNNRYFALYEWGMPLIEVK